MARLMKPPKIVYDLRANPITFDFATFLASATLLCRAENARAFDLVIVATGFRNATAREKSYSLEERLWRLDNLILPVARLCKNVKNLTVITNESNLPDLTGPDVYPLGFSFKTPARVDYAPRFLCDLYHKVGGLPDIFEASVMAKRIVNEKLSTKYKSLVTLSPRVASFDNSRNSPLLKWWDLYQMLVNRGYFVMVLPDFDDVIGHRELWHFDWPILDSVAYSLDLRMAALQAAQINIVSSGGLGALAIYSSVPYIICNVLHEGNTVANARYYKDFCALDVGSQYPWAQTNQRFDWSPFDAERIVAQYF